MRRADRRSRRRLRGLSRAARRCGRGARGSIAAAAQGPLRRRAPAQVPALRAGATRLGAELLHHDGAADGAGAAPFAALVARADVVVFPVDRVSHDAALAVKRHCGRLGRPFPPLRSSGVSSFVAALAPGNAPSGA